MGRILRCEVLLVMILSGLLSIGFGCSSDDKKKATDVAGETDGINAPDGSQDWTGADTHNQVPVSFSNNVDLCKITETPLSAVTSQVDVTPELLQAFASRLQEEGYDVFAGPEVPVVADPVVTSDIGAGLDLRDRETVSPPDVQDDGVGDDAVNPPWPDVAPDLDVPPVWTGGPYVIARTPLADMIYVTSEGVLGVVSWCPVQTLGQIRRLDYALADAFRLWGDVAVFDYTAETEGWTRPMAYYTKVEGTFQRSYMSDSLEADDPHEGVISISGKPVMAAIALYGHADVPSQAGDLVGMDMLQVGQKVIAEADVDISTGQASFMWNITPFAGEGELPVVIDAAVRDPGLEWEVGLYSIFADAVFPESVHGSFVMNLQGAPPGKLLRSKLLADLLVHLPPFEPLF
jgi:hypothetical protein